MDMIEVKTAELIGPALDWAMAQIEGVAVKREHSGDDGNGNCVIWLSYTTKFGTFDYSPYTDWSQGGPLIEKFSIDIQAPGTPTGEWDARMVGYPEGWSTGKTALIAVCRAVVAATLGHVVSVPAELVAA